MPAAYAFARFKFRLGENIAFTLLSFRFAPPLLVLLPLSLYFRQLGLTDTWVGLIWVYQLIALPLILWIVRGYFEDISPDIEHAYRIDGHGWWRTFTRIALPLARPGIAAAGLLAFIFCWNNFVFALILASADKQPVTVGAGLRHRIGHPVRPDRGRRDALDHADPAAGPLRPALPGRGPVARGGEGMSAVRLSLSQRRQALRQGRRPDGVSLEVASGEIVVICGPPAAARPSCCA